MQWTLFSLRFSPAPDHPKNAFYTLYNPLHYPKPTPRSLSSPSYLLPHLSSPLLSPLPPTQWTLFKITRRFSPAPKVTKDARNMRLCNELGEREAPSPESSWPRKPSTKTKSELTGCYGFFSYDKEEAPLLKAQMQLRSMVETWKPEWDNSMLWVILCRLLIESANDTVFYGGDLVLGRVRIHNHNVKWPCLFMKCFEKYTDTRNQVGSKDCWWTDGGLMVYAMRNPQRFLIILG